MKYVSYWVAPPYYGVGDTLRSQRTVVIYHGVSTDLRCNTSEYMQSFVRNREDQYWIIPGTLNYGDFAP